MRFASVPPGLRIRRLDGADKELRRAHLQRLGSEARRARFRGLAGADDPPEPALAVGALVEGLVRGVAELYPLGPSSRSAEAALSVEPAFQGRGLGTALLDRLVVLARNRGLAAVELWCAEDNGRLLALLRHLDARLAYQDGDVRARLELLPASPATLALERLEQWEGLVIRATALGRHWRGRCRARWMPSLVPGLGLET